MTSKRKAGAGWLANRTRAGLVLGLVGFGLATLIGQSGLSKYVDAPIYDAAVRSFEPVPVDPRVAAVYVGDADIAAFEESYGRWPWQSRELHGIAAAVMSQGGAIVLGYDMLFSESSLSDTYTDEELADHLLEAPLVVHGMLFQTTEGARWSSHTLSADAQSALNDESGTYGIVPDATQWIGGAAPAMPIDELLATSTALGHLNPSPDHDFAIRRVPLFVRWNGALYPSLAMRVAMAALELTAEQIEVDVEGREIRLDVGPGDDVIRVPIDPDGTMWIHYDRPKEEIPAVLYSQLDRAAEQGLFEDAYVIVGVSVSASSDTWRTPLATQHQGFMIHAQILENLLTRRFVRAIQPDRYPTRTPEIFLLGVLLVLSLALGVAACRFDPRIGWPATALAAALPIVAGTFALIHHDTWVPPTTATVALGLTGLLGVGYRQVSEIVERMRLRRVYERYLSPAVLQSVLDDPALLQLGGARKELTVFFSDIRGFTPYSETVEPVELTERLNEYYGAMIWVAHEHGATVDKLIGDSLMAFYGDPVAQPDHALRAVETALETQARLRELSADWQARGVHVFGVGIGIATGDVAVGNLGSDTFVDYTVIGSVVNLAARLQGSAAAGEILIGPRTYELVADRIEAESLGEQTFKGIAGPHEVFRVLGRRP